MEDAVCSLNTPLHTKVTKGGQVLGMPCSLICIAIHAIKTFQLACFAGTHI